MNRILKGLIAFLLFTVTLSGFAAAQSNSDAQLLFVVLSKKMHIKKIDKQSNSYRLTLLNVNPKVIYFTNRPYRKSGTIALPTFLKTWTTGTFKKVPPNAVIEAIKMNMNRKHAKSDRTNKKNNGTVNYIAVLINPNYNAAKNSLSFTIKPLKNSQQALPDMSHADYAAVFIDNVCASCIWGGS